MTEYAESDRVDVAEIRARWQKITDDHADGRAGPTAKLVFRLLDEIEQTQPFIENYYRLLAEDEGTWADWARKLADALACVLNNPRGGYEQADNYIRAQGIGAKVLASYRVHIDGSGGAGTMEP